MLRHHASKRVGFSPNPCFKPEEFKKKKKKKKKFLIEHLISMNQKKKKKNHIIQVLPSWEQKKGDIHAFDKYEHFA